MTNLKITICGLLIFFSVESFAVGTMVDSLISLENSKGKNILVKDNQRMQIWLENNTLVYGNFRALDENSLTIMRDSNEEIIPLEFIEHVRFNSSEDKNWLGLIWTVIGVLVLIIGVSLAVLAINGWSFGLASTLLGILVPLAGIGALFGGSRLKGRKIDLKKWKIRDS